MVSIYACTLLIVGASLAIGRAILVALGAPRPAWMSGVTGFAALVIVAPLLLRLPGRATTALIVVGLVDARVRLGRGPGRAVLLGAHAILRRMGSDWIGAWSRRLSSR